MKSSKNLRCSIIVIFALVILITSSLPLQIGTIQSVKGGKYGDIVPTSFELQLLNKINENRTECGVAPLKLNTTLWWVTRAHSQDMIDYDFFDHKSSEEGQFNGATFKERVNDHAEYKSTYIGETIALKGSGIDVEWCMAAWKNSPPHWEIIINPNFREIGIGLLEGEWGGSPNAGLHTADFGGGSIAVDLTVTSSVITFDPPSPNEGQVVNISAGIRNLGMTDAFPVDVAFFDGDPGSGGGKIGTKQIPHILVHGESANVNLLWDTTGKTGGHDIYVVADWGNTIAETNEGNNKAFKSLIVNPTGSPIDPIIHLDEGWNLVSFPHIMSDTSIEHVLSSIDDQYDAVQHYNSSDGNDPWKHHHILKPSHMNDLRNLDNKRGFWIHIIDANGADLTLYGDSPSSPQYISLRQGWNLVGYPSNTSRKRDVALNNLVFGMDIDAVEYYDNSDQRIRKLGEKGYMKPGRGYWLHAIQDCVWIVNN